MPPQREVSVEDYIRQEADRAGVPIELALAVAEQESGFDPTATGQEIAVGGKKVRARGTFQLLPETAARFSVDPADPIQNIQGGTRYLRELLDRHEGDLQKVLAEYGGVKTNQTYVPGVLARIPKFRPETQAALRGGRFVLDPTVAGGVRVGAPPPGSYQTARPEAFARPKTIAERVAPTVLDLVSGFDPRTRQGRRNWAGALGATAATAAVVGTAPVSVPTLALGATAGALGAAGAGMLAEAGEQIVGTAPPSGRAVLYAGGEQAGYEAFGQTLAWPFRGAGKKVISVAAGSRAVQAFKEAVAMRPSRVGAGQAAAAVVQRGRPGIPAGAAELERSAVGQRVSTAAATGPAVDIRPLKEEAERILTEQIRPPGEAFPARPLESVRGAFDREKLGGLRDLTAQRIAQREAAVAALAEAEKVQAQTTLSHPVMKVIGRIMNAEDLVPFQAAHEFKRDLDDALQQVWERGARKKVEGITEHLRTTLRQAMRGHLPYDEATAEYEAIAPLFYKGLVPKIRKQALTEPEALIDQIRGNRPTSARKLQAVLTELGGPEGQVAWDSVRAAWTRDKLIRGQGGLSQLSKRIEALDPEFVDVFYGDATGRQVLRGLKGIIAAYDASPLVRPGAQEVVPDVLRASALGPGSIWGALSIWRLLRGPRASELVELAAYQPEIGNALTKFLSGPWAIGKAVSPDIGMAVANLVRLLEPTRLLDVQGLTAQVGQPPPSARPAGTPTGVGSPPPR